MTYETANEAQSGAVLVGRAMRRNAAWSMEGVLERLFAWVFNGLVYPQIWEDPVVDMKAMELAPDHHVVAIASGGCNAMSYLTAGPARITAVDLNPAHVALMRLKLAGAARFTHAATFHRFFGEADDPENVALYDRHLAPALDHPSRAYWEGRDWLGRRRIRMFASGLYRKGLLGHFIAVGHRAARAYGVDLRSMLAAQSLGEQRRIFDSEIAPLFDKRLVKWLTDRRASLYGLGIPPAQYAALSGGRSMSDVLRERLQRLACAVALKDNYFAWQAFGRSYAPSEDAARPPYLEPRNFAALKSNASRVEVHQASITDVLNRMPPASADRFVLLDAQDWMNDAQLNALWSAISRASRPGARVIFRTAGEDTILPGRVRPHILDRWTYLEARSQELHLEDRSAIYGGFHVYERAG
jgi:S-adenosylmethionine-diacylglycerol 3-amino-3-carboxypropyl transferase